MSNFARRWMGQLPIRVRLTLFYLVTLAVILAIFAAFVYLRVRKDLYAQVDSALEVAAIQAVAVIDQDEPFLTFEDINLPPAVQQRLDDFSITLFDPTGKLLDSIGVQGPTQRMEASTREQMPDQMPDQIVDTQGEVWRVYAEPVLSSTQQIVAWVQVAQTLKQVDQTLSDLQFQFWVGIPLALILAGLSGLWLATQAMEPINQITRTAQAIHEDDLTKRIHYTGPADEVGRLAATFDQMLSRLQAAFERQVHFTSDAAHELRTPLGALKARLDVVLSQTRLPSEYQAALQDMDRQVNRLTRLTQELLFIARIDQGEYKNAQEVIDFDEFIAGIIEQMMPLAKAKAITLQNRSPLPVALVGNLDMLIRLFLNLLDNAIRYTHVGGEVAVRVYSKGTSVSIAIQDNGSGISQEHLPHLFDRFYRIESSRERSPNAQSGNGLGLAIAYEIVRIHGGKLRAESELGHGSTFTVELPTVLPTALPTELSTQLSAIQPR